MELARRLTLGGIKVERPRRQMKLMVKISYSCNCYHKLLFLVEYRRTVRVFNEPAVTDGLYSGTYVCACIIASAGSEV